MLCMRHGYDRYDGKGKDDGYEQNRDISSFWQSTRQLIVHTNHH